MSDQKLSALSHIPAPIGVTDLFYTVQSGTSYKATGQDILDFTGSANNALEIVGTWNAATNTPTLADGVGNAWEGYEVTVAGNTLLDGVGAWQVGDVLIFDGNSSMWKKLFNTNYTPAFRIAGIWDATANTTVLLNGQPGPSLASGIGNFFESYIVGTSGNTNLDGTSDWNQGDTAIFVPTISLPSPSGFWVKGMVNRINGRGGIVTFPATQYQIFFGSSDNWIDQDPDLLWNSFSKRLVASNGSTNSGTNTAIVGGQNNSFDSNCFYSTISGGRTVNVIGSTHTEIGGGDQLSITNIDRSFVGGGQQHTIDTGTGVSCSGGFQHSLTSSNYSGWLGGYTHTVDLASQCFAVGGSSSQITQAVNSVITGGNLNRITGTDITNISQATISGGESNLISASDDSHIAGATNSSISASSAPTVIVGGDGNQITNGAITSIIGGNRIISDTSWVSSFIAGEDNTDTGSTQSSMLGGHFNSMYYNGTTAVIGGDSNSVQGAADSAVIGGRSNAILVGDQNFIAAGQFNNITGVQYGAIIGGDTNEMSSSISDAVHACVMLGGASNSIDDSNRSFTVGGLSNQITTAQDAFIVGGDNNTHTSNFGPCGMVGSRNTSVTGCDATVVCGGGAHTLTNFYYGGVLGGANHIGSGNPNWSVFLGGTQCQISGSSSYTLGSNSGTVAADSAGIIGGQSVTVSHQGTVVIADSINHGLSSTATDQLILYFSGGVGIKTNSTTADLSLNGSMNVGYVKVNLDAYTITDHDYIVGSNYTGVSAPTYIMPTAHPGRKIIIKDEANSALLHPITIQGPSGQTFNGGPLTLTIGTNGGSYNLYSDGTNWFTH